MNMCWDADLHGRGRERWLIIEQLHAARREKNGVILLDGSRGSGKSTLLRHIAGMAEKWSFDVIAGPAGQHRRLLLAASLANGIARFRPFHGTASRNTGERCAGVLSETIDAELGRQAAGVGRDMAGPRPVLIALDDVTWNDPDVCSALAGLPLAATSRPVLWLFAGRTESRPDGPPGGAGALRLTLGPLSPHDAARLAAARLGGVPDSRLGRLVQACGGHPGLLTATLDTLIACGGYRVSHGTARLTAEPPPRRVLTALLREDPRLSGRARELAAVVAARPHALRLSELMRLPYEAAVHMMPAVREAVDAGVLVADGGQLRFRHPLLREAACLLLSDRVPPRPGTYRATQPGLVPEQAPAPAAVAPIGLHTRDKVEHGLLTRTERNIVLLVADGLTNRQIASRINRSPHTVNFHLRKIFRKLGVSSRAELAGTHLHLLHAVDEPQPMPRTQENRTADAR